MLFAALLGSSGVVSAQPLPAPSEDAMRAPTPPAGAIEHYERGRREYLAGRYQDALQELKAALALDPNSPNLVYNVARVNEDLSEFDEAIKYYNRYRMLLPPGASEERDKTEKTIRRLQGARDELEQRRRTERLSEPAPPAPPQLTASAGRADVLFWAVAGSGLALAAASGVTGVLALRREKAVGDFVIGRGRTLAQRDELRKEADTLAVASDVMSVAAGVALVSAVVLFFSRTSEPTIEAAAYASPHAAGINLSTRF